MPYIHQLRRDALANGADVETPGELNYRFTLELVEYLTTHGVSYTALNDVLGALEGAKLEFVRRIVNPYETYKMRQLGDVYDDVLAGVSPGVLNP